MRSLSASSSQGCKTSVFPELWSSLQLFLHLFHVSLVQWWRSPEWVLQLCSTFDPLLLLQPASDSRRAEGNHGTLYQIVISLLRLCGGDSRDPWPVFYFCAASSARPILVSAISPERLKENFSQALARPPTGGWLDFWWFTVTVTQHKPTFLTIAQEFAFAN